MCISDHGADLGDTQLNSMADHVDLRIRGRRVHAWTLTMRGCVMALSMDIPLDTLTQTDHMERVSHCNTSPMPWQAIEFKANLPNMDHSSMELLFQTLFDACCSAVPLCVLWSCCSSII